MLEETTIHQIRSTISKLEQEGAKVTIIEIARRLGMSKQRVHFVLSKHEELDKLTTSKRRASKPRIAKSLKGYNTKNLFIDDILKLPIKGMELFTYDTLRALLMERNIPYHETVMEKVEAVKECGVDLSETTARELGELVGAENISRFRGVLYSYDVPYKRVSGPRKSRRKLEVPWQALTVLNGIDTSQHTFDQLHQMVGKDVVERAYLYRHLQKYGLKFKRHTWKLKD